MQPVCVFMSEAIAPVAWGGLCSTPTSDQRSHAVDLTSGQPNAVRQVKSYLRYSACSLSGLIGQLGCEGFPLGRLVRGEQGTLTGR